MSVDTSPTTKGPRGNLEAAFPGTRYSIAFYNDASEAASSANELKAEAEAFGMSSADADRAIHTVGSTLFYVQNRYLPTTKSVEAFAACLTP